jgi:glutathione S-transferase
MIILRTFGPYFGVPDPNPFVMKAMLLLKFAGLDYAQERGGLRKAPKAKLPFIEDDGELIADSTFIRFHLEKKYRFDFDASLTAEQKSVAWALEIMCEEHLYFALMAKRWLDDENFAKGPAQFFAAIPMPFRLAIQKMIRGRVRKTLYLQGLGRHTRGERDRLAIADIDAIATILGEKPFFMGDSPCGADASIFGFAASVMAPAFTGPVRAAAEKHQNLVGYRDRVLRRCFQN